jgi:hypothetical protein
MATMETVDFGPYGKIQLANISTVVGQGLPAERDDIMLIQALIWLIGGYDEVFSRHFFGVEKNDLPDIDGICDRRTVNAIWAFQRKQRHRVLGVDGKIHPGKYQDRVLEGGPTARQMMITLLNLFAIQTRRIKDLSLILRQIAPYIVFK